MAKVIDDKHHQERPGWRKDPLLAIKLAARGEHAAAEIAEIAGDGFATLQDARRRLLVEHGLEVTCQRVWYRAKKLGGVLRVPRPSHSRKDPAAACEFRDELGGKLESLGLVAGTRAKVWIMDEARFGLHTMLRKLWSLARFPPGGSPDICSTSGTTFTVRWKSPMERRTSARSTESTWSGTGAILKTSRRPIPEPFM
jgi:hypothetical protein